MGLSPRKVTIGGCSSNAESFGELRYRFPGRSKAAKLLLAVRGELVRLGRLVIVGCDATARCGATFAAEFEFEFSEGRHDRGHCSACRSSGVNTFP